MKGRSGWLALGLLGLLVGAALLMQILVRSGRNDGPPYSIQTHRADDGLWFLYRAARSAGLDATGLYHPPDLLSPEIARLVVWQPAGMTASDWRGLEAWVRAGGELVLSLPPLDNGNQALTVPQTLTVPPGVHRVAYTHPSALSHAAPQPTVAPGPPLLPPTYRLAVPYVVDDTGGAQVVGWPLEKGFVWQVANPAWFTGSSLTAHPDNLALALALITPSRPGKVAFDEYHHGVKAPETWYQVLRPNLTFAFVELALALALTLWALGGRLGRPLVVPVAEQRESREYVTALAGLLRQARGGAQALAYTRRRVTATLRRRLGVGPLEDDAVLAERFARLTGRDAAAVLGLLRETAQPGQRSDADVLRLTAALQELLHVIRPAAAGGKGAPR